MYLIYIADNKRTIGLLPKVLYCQFIAADSLLLLLTYNLIADNALIRRILGFKELSFILLVLHVTIGLSFQTGISKHNSSRKNHSRGLFRDFVSGVLYIASSQVLGKNLTNTLVPIAKPIVKEIVPEDPIRFEDGHLVVGFDQGKTTKKPSSTNPPKSCRTPKGKAGQCLTLSDCPQLLLDLRVLQSSICFQNIFLVGVCCPRQTSFKPASKPPLDLSTTTPSPKTTTLKPSVTTKSQLFDFPIRPGFLNADITPSAAKHSCGERQVSEFRIVGGESSSTGQWPWMAAIYLHGVTGNIFWCGGSLISPTHVVTAAHCTRDTNNRGFDPKQFTVRLGDNDLDSVYEPSRPKSYSVRDYVTHPDFKKEGFYNDIAILQLEQAAEFNQFVSPVCLPDEFEGRHMDTFTGMSASVIGWGVTEYGGKEAHHLRHATLPIWRQNDCDRAYFQPIREMFICAGHAVGGKDACQGDSGSPLVLYRYGHWMQLGIVSFGNQCAKAGYPGVYTRITTFLPWIRNVTSIQKRF